MQARAKALAENQEAVIGQQLADKWPAIVEASAKAFGSIDQLIVLNGADGITDILAKVVAQSATGIATARALIDKTSGKATRTTDVAPSNGGASPVTLWARLRHIFEQRANAALDQAEDPIAAFELAYTAQIRAHEQAKRGIADVLTSEKRLEMEVRSLAANADRAFAAAGEAAQLGDDSKARSLLEREAFLSAQRDRLLSKVDDVKAQRKTLEATTEMFWRRLEAMRTERLALRARYTTAKATIRATEHVTGLSQEMSDVARRSSASGGSSGYRGHGIGRHRNVEPSSH